MSSLSNPLSRAEPIRCASGRRYGLCSPRPTTPLQTWSSMPGFPLLGRPGALCGYKAAWHSGQFSA